MYAGGHRGGCCGINELRLITPGDIAKGGLYDHYFQAYSWRHKMQYRVHCPNDKRSWMWPELVASGFTLLATNDDETVWGKVG